MVKVVQRTIEGVKADGVGPWNTEMNLLIDIKLYGVPQDNEKKKKSSLWNYLSTRQ